MINESNTCFFSGHRHLPYEKTQRISELLEKEIIERYNCGITNFISGGALGFDTIAGNIVLKLKKNTALYEDMKLILYIPCYSYGMNWNYEQRCDLHRLKSNADFFEIIVKEQYTDDCIKIRNQKMVDDACCGIVYKTIYKSGTSQTVSMAKKQNKSVINLADNI